MSYENMFGFEIYRMALRDTVNENSADGGQSDGQDAVAASASATAMTPADAMAKVHATGDSEQQELGDVARLDPLKRPADSAMPASSQRVLLVTRPSQRYVHERKISLCKRVHITASTTGC